MTEPNDDRLKKFIKQTLPPAEVELRRDLWPQMLRRLDERPASVPWFDWALLAGLILSLCLMPGVIPVLLYHL